MNKSKECKGEQVCMRKRQHEWKYRIIAFGIIFFSCLVIQLTLGVKEFIDGDAWDYWDRGESLWRGGQFSFLHLKNGFRGYVFPLVVGVCNQIGGMLCYRIVNSLMTATLFCVLLPDLLEVKVDSKEKCIFEVVCYCLITLFFYGLQTYALSDQFTVFLCLLTIFLGKRFTNTTSKSKIVILSIFVGMGAYAMYNVRTIYIFAAAYILGYWLIYFVREKKIMEKVAYIIGCVFGIGFAGLPQAYINWNFERNMSISVPTNNLMLLQLDWGLRYQRYDTYVGGIQQNIPQMYFVDAVGGNILQKEGIYETGIESWGQYIGLLFKYPFEILGIYTRHFFNMFFPAWPNQYVLNLDNNKIFIMIISFTCFFLFAMACILGHMNNRNIGNFIPLLLPVIAITPGAVECRYFMPLYIVVLGKICFDIDWTNMMADVKKYWYKVVMCYCVSFCVLVSMWSSMLASENAYMIFF